MNDNRDTAAYERLSKGDEERSGESVSIQNQKVLLEQYAKKHGFRNVVHYTDDDESGRFFDRPGFVQMMEDVENGKIGIIILKEPYVKHILKIFMNFFTKFKNRACVVQVRFFNLTDYTSAAKLPKQRRFAFSTFGIANKPLA